MAIVLTTMAKKCSLFTNPNGHNNFYLFSLVSVITQK